MGQVGDDRGNDPTRKQRREQARSERRAAEQAAAQGVATRRRLKQLAAATTLVALAIVAVLLLSGGAGSTPPAATSSTAVKDVALVDAELSGTSEKANVLGNPDAPATMQYFGDLECPVCRDFTLGALPSIIRRWVKSGRLKIEYRSFSTATGNAEAGGAEPRGMFDLQQAAALAAGEQDRAWYFIELFYNEQGTEGSGYVTEAFLQGLARQVPGLDLPQWTADRGNQAFNARIASENREAETQGLNGTPAILIGKMGGPYKKYEYTSLTDPSGFDEAIEAALAS
jgi:protein-disulfide isomerase